VGISRELASTRERNDLFARASGDTRFFSLGPWLERRDADPGSSFERGGVSRVV